MPSTWTGGLFRRGSKARGSYLLHRRRHLGILFASRCAPKGIRCRRVTQNGAHLDEG